MSGDEGSRVASLDGDARAPGVDPWVVLATACALLLRLVRIGRAPAWFDETYTATWVGLGWADMVRQSAAGNHPPLYFVLLKAWSAVAGSSPAALRVPGALFAAATVPVVAGIAFRAAGRRAARWTAFFCAISPFLLHHAQEARMYPLVVLLAAVLTSALLREAGQRASPADGPRHGAVRGTLFAAAAVPLAASHYYGAAFVALATLLLLAFADPTDRRRLLPCAGIALLAVVASAATAWRWSEPAEAGQPYAIGLAALPGIAWCLVGGWELLPDSVAVHAAGVRAALPFLPVVVPGLAAAAVLVVAARRALSGRDWRALAVLAGASILIPVVAAALFGVGVNPRYAAPGLPALLVLLGAGAADTASPSVAGGTRARLAARTAAVLVVLPMLLATGIHLAAPGHGREDVAAAGDWLAANVPPAEEIVVTSEEMATLAAFHWPGRPRRTWPPYGVVADRVDAARLADGLPFPGGDRAIVVLGRDWTSDPRGEFAEALVERWVGCGETRFAGIRILCLRRTRTDADRGARAGGIPVSRRG